MSLKNKINIFIVDDDKVFRLALTEDIKSAFKKTPIVINSFETGEKCMEEFKIVQPEVVILDYQLNSKYPDAVDGIKMLDWIKKENPETNVIMLTVDDNMDIALTSFHHGAVDYIVKKTETQFKKINQSLLNLFKMMEAQSYEKRYKELVILIYICIAILIGVVIAVRMSYRN